MAIIFLILSALCAVLIVIWGKLRLWAAAPIFLGCFLLVNLLYLSFWALAALSVDVSKPIEKQSRLCRRGCVRIAELTLAYSGVRSRVTGMEKLPTDRRFLLVCNHLSLFDPLIIFVKLRKYNISFVSKQSNLKMPFLGRIAYGAGTLPLDRENDREALKTILRAAGQIKSGLCSMAIFPEGTRNRTEAPLLPFHAGSFKIAQKANAPVVICCVKNTDAIEKNIFRRFTDAELEILELLPAETVKSMKTQELAEISMAKIENCLKREEK